MIKVEHANKTFSGKYGTVHALQDVSIHVEKGDIYGIIGFSGAGKGTVIKELLKEHDNYSLSISATKMHGDFAIFAIPIFTRSSLFKFISAGLPAPSIIDISNFSFTSFS